ncbi:MAG TPA: 2-dehydropantoate 2-reductase [Opitutaceae bacterium]|jgi:2-dehydropantoate 2-reductase
MEGAFPSVAVVGSGAVGLYYGGRMALAGARVQFLMRGDLAAVRARGSVIVHDRSGTSVLRPVEAFGSAGEMAKADVVLVALKTTSGPARELVRPLLGGGSAILTLQNGFGADEALARDFGAEQVMGGLVFMAINRLGPGESRCFNQGMVTIGEYSRGPRPRTEDLARLLRAAGFKTNVAADLVEARWSKLVWNIPFNGLSVAEGGITTDRICAEPRLAAEARALMAEVQRAAAAFGYRIEDAFVDKQFQVTPPMGAYQPSSLVDFLAGREVEVESIWGEPLRRAEAAGVPMPHLSALYARLRAACP